MAARAARKSPRSASSRNWMLENVYSNVNLRFRLWHTRSMLYEARVYIVDNCTSTDRERNDFFFLFFFLFEAENWNNCWTYFYIYTCHLGQWTSSTSDQHRHRPVSLLCIKRNVCVVVGRFRKITFVECNWRHHSINPIPTFGGSPRLPWAVTDIHFQWT